MNNPVFMSKAMAQNTIKMPFPIEAPQEKLNIPQSIDCKRAPTPPSDMNFVSVYTDKSQGVSIVDPAAKKKYDKQIHNIRNFEKQIVQWTQRIIEGHKSHSNFCALIWLDSWAKRDIFLKGKMSFQGESLRKWTLATISTQYALLDAHVNIPLLRKQRIEAWIEKIGSAVIDDFSVGLDRNSRHNNHMYWAAWGVMSASFTLNNDDFFKWGVKKYKQAISEIDQDGFLPRELERQSKALNYHMFGLAPLVMIAETGKVNGVELYQYKNRAIHRLVTRVVYEIDNNQKSITKKSGKAQNMERVISNNSLAWMAPYNKRFKKQRVQKWVDQYEPLKSTRLGGDLSYYFKADQF